MKNKLFDGIYFFVIAVFGVLSFYYASNTSLRRHQDQQVEIEDIDTALDLITQRLNKIDSNSILLELKELKKEFSHTRFTHDDAVRHLMESHGFTEIEAGRQIDNNRKGQE